uniref:CCHC-type domain-containing protein n=1 Tax=Ditylenchus dipsaci TaxID=166011 RepID=A0A915E6L3_9BILA
MYGGTMTTTYPAELENQVQPAINPSVLLATPSELCPARSSMTIETCPALSATPSDNNPALLAKPLEHSPEQIKSSLLSAKPLYQRTTVGQSFGPEIVTAPVIESVNAPVVYSVYDSRTDPARVTPVNNVFQVDANKKSVPFFRTWQAKFSSDSPEKLSSGSKPKVTYSMESSVISLRTPVSSSVDQVSLVESESSDSASSDKLDPVEISRASDKSLRRHPANSTARSTVLSTQNQELPPGRTVVTTGQQNPGLMSRNQSLRDDIQRKSDRLEGQISTQYEGLVEFEQEMCLRIRQSIESEQDRIDLSIQRISSDCQGKSDIFNQRLTTLQTTVEELVKSSVLPVVQSTNADPAKDPAPNIQRDLGQSNTPVLQIQREVLPLNTPEHVSAILEFAKTNTHQEYLPQVRRENAILLARTWENPVTTPDVVEDSQTSVRNIEQRIVEEIQRNLSQLSPVLLMVTQTNLFHEYASPEYKSRNRDYPANSSRDSSPASSSRRSREYLQRTVNFEEPQPSQWEGDPEPYPVQHPVYLVPPDIDHDYRQSRDYGRSDYRPRYSSDRSPVRYRNPDRNIQCYYCRAFGHKVDRCPRKSNHPVSQYQRRQYNDYRQSAISPDQTDQIHLGLNPD